MPGLKPVSRRVLVARLSELGFEGPFAGGRHQFVCRGDLDVVLPNPHRGDVGVGLLARILRQAGVTVAQWNGEPKK